MPIKNRIAEFHDEVTAWRRDIHQHPELDFDTVRTGALVAEKLAEFGCDEIVTGMAQNGVVGVIRGENASSGQVIGLRADMDALPIVENTGLPYASKTAGKMHACGHDGHTAMLLGAAKYLTETRHFNGTVVVVFQPAEEGSGGGKVMCDEGLMARFGIQEVYGMHNMPEIPLGEFAIRSGAFFAAVDDFTIHVQGRGGHAASPHHAIDTTLVASHIVIALQSIASRNTDPMEQVVLSVCGFQTESAVTNVIPENATLCGTIRSMSNEVRALAEQKLRHIATSTAATFGATAHIDFEPSYPVMINAEQQTKFCAEVAEKVSGKPTEIAAPIMGAEDFAYMLEERPGAYILVGNGDTAMVHHPTYNFNDEVIPAGASYWAELVERRMPAD